jgi:hypothetical protein
VRNTLVASVEQALAEAAGGPPDWLAYVSPAIALAALVVSFLAFRVNRKTFKAAGPGVRLMVSSGPLTIEWREVGVRVTVTNYGRAAVDVLGFTLLPDKGLMMYPQPVEPEGERLPYRLEASSSRTWSLNPGPLLVVYEVLTKYDHYPADRGKRSRRVRKKRIKRFRVEVSLGNGTRVTAEDDRYLDLEALREQKDRVKSIYEPTHETEEEVE